MDNKSMDSRDNKGRFLPGHKIGPRFKKGETGSKKGMKWKRTQTAAAFAREILGTDPEIGEKLTTPEVIRRISKHAERNTACMIELLRHDLGKPIERVRLEQPQFVLSTEEEKEALKEDQSQLGRFVLEVDKDESEEKAALPESD